MTLALYREAFEHHAEHCDSCSLITLQLCNVGAQLFDTYAKACAAASCPIPNIQRPVVKA
jgi:hypothetical protein